jgi:predicted amidohydrolase YtcJ
MKKLFLLLPFLIAFSCKSPKQSADMILHNGTVYTIDSIFSVHQAMALKDGKILATGSNEEILNTYTSDSLIDLKNRYVYPGFIDAHCHFYGYGKGLGEVNLMNTASFGEVIEKTVDFYKNNKASFELTTAKKTLSQQNWLIGRGWDQNDWENKNFPDKHQLDSLFPEIPVLLKRVDGHAALVNQKALSLAGITETSKINGGDFIKQNGKLTGVLIDNAVDEVEKLIPEPDENFIKKALLRAEKNCVAMGLTTIDDAGLGKNIIDVIQKMHQSGELKIKVYAMLTPSEENLNYFLKHGKLKTDRLNVCSFKFYADGALGSRGACLCHEYADQKNWKGFLLNNIRYFEKHAGIMAENGFQMNTHCIGDSAGKVILDIYQKYCGNGEDKRWRIEHAQVIKADNFKLFSKNILPSVQPTHATSDMYWAEKRLGKERVKNAYAYKQLLESSGCLPLGTDFPVEDISPFKTFFAAVVRKDEKGFPKNGFQMENAISRREALKGMTIWAAFSNFEEKEKGSLEKWKYADFIILDTDLLNCKEEDLLHTNVLATFVNGQKVYISGSK